MTSQQITQILIMLCCILFSAYFSATETAFSSLNKTRLKALAERGDKKAERALKLSDDYDKLISTILIGNNIVNILAASMGTLLFVSIYGDIGATVSTVVLTIVVLIFGEITPKSIAKDAPEGFAMFSAPLIGMLMWLLTPINFLFSQWKKLVAKVFKVSADNKMSQEELLLLVDEVQQEGSIDEDEGELLRNAIEFGDMEAQDILTHRVELEAVELTATKEEIADKFTETRYSRLLVYDDSIDNIVGVIHQKDFYVGSGVTPKPLQEIMAPPLFIQQSEKINDLLQQLQANKSHIAVVLDEYGGTLGIVTMEDILEELVGDIWDEHDEVVEDFKKVSEGHYLVDCTVNLEEFFDRFAITCEDTDSISLGGWIMEQLSKIPVAGDSFTYENLHITVKETDNHRVASASVEILQEEAESVAE